VLLLPRRLDKFYQLAKEQGYRSRASFKLIQLNKKYDFLSKARGCIDLCAAPGSWCVELLTCPTLPRSPAPADRLIPPCVPATQAAGGVEIYAIGLQNHRCATVYLYRTSPSDACRCSAETQLDVAGVDLVPIRPIRNVVTFTEDITTQKCYAALTKELDGHAVDLVGGVSRRVVESAASLLDTRLRAGAV
jgi:hypothetical protein